MWLEIFISWLIGAVITIVPFALLAITPTALLLFFTVGMPYNVFAGFVDDIFQILGIDRAQPWVLNAQAILPGVGSSLFYGAVVYFLPFLRPLRSPKRYRTLLTLSLILVIGASGMLIAFAPPYPVVIENRTEAFVPAALDLRSCEILAVNQFEAKIRPAYDESVSAGNVVLLKNGTEADPQGKVLNYENQHLVPWKSTGPITYGEQISRHIAVYQWVRVKEGPYAGKSVCLSTSMVHGKYPPL